MKNRSFNVQDASTSLSSSNGRRLYEETIRVSNVGRCRTSAIGPLTNPIAICLLFFFPSCERHFSLVLGCRQRWFPPFLLSFLVPKEAGGGAVPSINVTFSPRRFALFIRLN